MKSAAFDEFDSLRSHGLRFMLKLFGIVLCISSHLWADVSDNPKNLVGKLGSKDFAARSEAEKQLLQMGYRSFSEVYKATQASEPEVRIRAERLLKYLQRSAISDFEEQLLANPWTVPPELAPGWEEFQEMLGDGAESRELYVLMLHAELELMVSLGQPNWRSVFEKRCAELHALYHQRRSVELPAASIAAILFVACLPENQPSAIATSVVFTLMRDHSFRDPAMNSQSSDILKSLVSLWIKRSTIASPIQRLGEAAAYQLDAAMEIARETIERRKQAQVSPIHLENSIFYLARYGGMNVIEELEALLDDRQLIRSRGSGSELNIEVRDIALAALIAITRQDHQEYGFQGLRVKKDYMFIGSSIQFRSIESHEQAFEKWRAWRAEHHKRTVPEGLDASLGELAIRACGQRD